MTAKTEYRCCGNCEFFSLKHSVIEAGDGECRRDRPFGIPLLVATEPGNPNSKQHQVLLGTWAKVMAHHFCGQWQKRTKTKAYHVQGEILNRRRFIVLKPFESQAAAEEYIKGLQVVTGIKGLVVRREQ